MMMMNCFCGMVDLRTARAVFPERTIVRKPHHGDFPTSRGGNQSWIAETTIHSGATTTLMLFIKILRVR